MLNAKLLAKDPIISFGLIIRKPFEWFFLYIGTLWPVNFNQYKSKDIAKNYDKLRSGTNYQNYKSYCEKIALLKLLDKDSSIIEVGSGTGRITRYLIENGFKVVPTEPSDTMIKEYQKIKNLPVIKKLAAEQLDTLDLIKDVVLGIRVIWHIKSIKTKLNILKASALASKNSVIYDFVNADHYIRFPLNFIFYTYSFLFNKSFLSQSFAMNLNEIKILSRKAGLRISRIIPLDICQHVWLYLVPKKYATNKLFSYIYKFDNKIVKIIPPGRWIIKFQKIKFKLNKKS